MTELLFNYDIRPSSGTYCKGFGCSAALAVMVFDGVLFSSLSYKDKKSNYHGQFTVHSKSHLNGSCVDE